MGIPCPTLVHHADRNRRARHEPPNRHGRPESAKDPSATRQAEGADAIDLAGLCLAGEQRHEENEGERRAYPYPVDSPYLPPPSYPLAPPPYWYYRQNPAGLLSGRAAVPRGGTSRHGVHALKPAQSPPPFRLARY